MDLASLKRLVSYWQEGYDWRIWEAKLNAYPEFTTTIDDNFYLGVIYANYDRVGIGWVAKWLVRRSKSSTASIRDALRLEQTIIVAHPAKLREGFYVK